MQYFAAGKNCKINGIIGSHRQKCENNWYYRAPQAKILIFKSSLVGGGTKFSFSGVTRPLVGGWGWSVPPTMENPVYCIPNNTKEDHNYSNIITCWCCLSRWYPQCK